MPVLLNCLPGTTATGACCRGGPGRATQATNYYAYVQTFQNSNVGYGASIAVVLFVFAAIVSFYIARFNARYSNA